MMNNGDVTIRLGSASIAVYQAGSKEIVYNENLPGILLHRSDVLAHELFHAYQHQMVYDAAFLNYGLTYDANGNKVYHPGYINVEFEQIVFQDIVKRISDGPSGVGDMFTEPGYVTAQNQYKLWIDTLTSHGTAYPDLNSITGFDAAYMTHLNNFKIYGHTGYTGSAIIPGLLPDALKQLYNNSLNCND